MTVVGYTALLLCGGVYASTICLHEQNLPLGTYLYKLPSWYLLDFVHIRDDHMLCLLYLQEINRSNGSVS